MNNDTIPNNDLREFARNSLDEFSRLGSQTMLAAALKAEVEGYLQQ